MRWGGFGNGLGRRPVPGRKSSVDWRGHDMETAGLRVATDWLMDVGPRRPEDAETYWGP